MGESQISNKNRKNVGKTKANRNKFDLHLLADLLTSHMREIRYYRTAAGQSPIDDFLDALPGKESQKVLWTFKLIEDFEAVPAQYLKKLKNTDDIWEIRVISSGKAYRFLGFFHGRNSLFSRTPFLRKRRKHPEKRSSLHNKENTIISKGRVNHERR